MKKLVLLALVVIMLPAIASAQNPGIKQGDPGFYIIFMLATSTGPRLSAVDSREQLTRLPLSHRICWAGRSPTRPKATV